jgi:hypothetical protein
MNRSGKYWSIRDYRGSRSNPRCLPSLVACRFLAGITSGTPVPRVRHDRLGHIRCLMFWRAYPLIFYRYPLQNRINQITRRDRIAWTRMALSNAQRKGMPLQNLETRIPSGTPEKPMDPRSEIADLLRGNAGFAVSVPIGTGVAGISGHTSFLWATDTWHLRSIFESVRQFRAGSAKAQTDFECHSKRCFQRFNSIFLGAMP